ncbi:MAG: efflux RND transporter periplasmic adaptor subunit [Paracoccus denitrificans]|nr:MAG: efflux RND transporter periplasmic adaptor subunit [Paracoccus denitrificans]PZO85475.1 MAG: efflux RND transporter periplasmic adaptor subunit [Paracoccus denitrificans]
MTRHLFVVIAALTLLTQPAVALTLPWQKEAAPAPMPPRPVVTELVSELPELARTVPGVIAASNTADLAFQTLGTITQRPVDVGDEVKAGQILARLNPDDLESDVRAAIAGRDAARVQLQTALSTAERTRALAERNVASTAQLEEAERALSAAQAQVRQTESQLTQAEAAQGFADITAPFDGVITAVQKDVGTLVAAGDTIMTLASVNDLEADIDLPEPMLANIEPGTGFVVRPEREEDDRRTPAVVQRIDPLADLATRTRRVHLKMEDASGYRIGALIRANIASDGGAILTLPRTAIVSGADGEQAIWLVNRQGDKATVSSHPITTGQEYLGRVQVTSGLEKGQEVVVRGANSLTEGQAVGRAVEP